MPSSLWRDGVVEGVGSEISSAVGVSAAFVRSILVDVVQKKLSYIPISACDRSSFLPVLLLSGREVVLPHMWLRWSSDSAKLRCAGSA